ncbi:MAG: hypothetical protein HY739_09520 [Desulfobacterales bacterium]|jgi:hypothetical protein|nr:hypothetical protein [Desulfobacterales bacterium]
MNAKRFIIASLVVFLGFEIIDAIVHTVILGKTYESMNLWRPDMMSKMWIIHIGSLILAFLFTYIFIKGYENKGITEGARYGVIIGLFANIPYGFYSYAMYPLPFSLCLQWFIFGMIEFIICGIIAAVIYKPNKI